MTSISKNVHIDKLDDIVNQYNKTYHRTIKMKPVNVEDNTYIAFGKDSNDKYLKFKIGDHVRISKRKKNFAKRYNPNFVISKVKNAVPLAKVNGEKIIGKFYEK